MKKISLLRKVPLFFSLFLSACCIFTGCSRQKEESVEITVIHGWGSAESDHESMRQIYLDFQKEHPEIHLNIMALPSDSDVISKMRELLTVGKVPDVVFTAGEGRDTIYQFMTEHSYALDLMPYLEADEEFKNSISPLAIETWTTEQGSLYTASDVLLMGGYWYNRSLFEQAGISTPPETWSEWNTACEKLKALGAHTTPQMNPLLLDTDHIVYLTNVFLHEKAPEELSNIKNNRINLQSSGFQSALQFLKDLSSCADTVNAYSFRDTLESFNNQETAIYINGVWGASLIDETIDAAYAAFPSDSGSSVAMSSSGVGYLLGNTGDQRRTDASIEFLKYMLSEEVGERLLTETKQVPANPNILITEDLVDERFYQAVSCIQKAEIIIEFPAVFWNTHLQEQYGERVISYLKEDLTFEQLQIQ